MRFTLSLAAQLLLLAACLVRSHGFHLAQLQSHRIRVLYSSVKEHEQESTSNAAAADHDDLARTKAKLLGWMSPKPSVDSVFADPVSKAPLLVYVKTSPVVEDASRRRLQYTLTSEDSSRTFAGSSDSYINLLEPVKEVELSPSASNKGNNNILRNTAPFIPPPLRSAVDQDYIPMRDLFTSPAVSFAYERGWRQGFRQAGFPGPDIEADMAMEYFAPTMAARDSRKVLVDMSCATGLFTRRFAESKKYDRVLGCDYSESMLQEAKRRIDRQWKKQSPSNLQLIRLDVGQIPMQNDSIDALHAGAAMHCWPDLPAAVSEIHRVLRPGGRYFATTFLSSYFASLRTLPGEDAGPSRQAFQYFSSTEELRALMEKGGFASEKLSIEVLGAACVIIRAEK